MAIGRLAFTTVLARTSASHDSRGLIEGALHDAVRVIDRLLQRVAYLLCHVAPLSLNFIRLATYRECRKAALI